ncbi:hypothetical protein ABI_24280 [Asticcacaulis biprosthecium C19]|uniref:Uncharacterized protein n=2 Tax=Asticcacaulis biprosthecium TaxID=76891 RepID=F4QNV7_9CAUL|nr:hypothetical protein ABI_24280 [Asticcacaulis biprosthecium C19]
MVAAVVVGFIFISNRLTPGHWNLFDTAIVVAGGLLVAAKLSSHLGRRLRHQSRGNPVAARTSLGAP